MRSGDWDIIFGDNLPDKYSFDSCWAQPTSTYSICVDFKHSDSAFGLPEASWRRMFLTNPPCPIFSAEWCGKFVTFTTRFDPQKAGELQQRFDEVGRLLTKRLAKGKWSAKAMWWRRKPRWQRR